MKGNLSGNVKQAAVAACHAAVEKKGENVALLDFQGSSSVADYFVLVTGRSQPHVRALTQGVEKALKELSLPRFGIEGYPHSPWIVLDYALLVVHLFTPEERDYYSLERLWPSAKIETFGEGN